MKNTVLFIHLIISIILSVAILLQAKGTGLGSTFGGSNEQYRSKRGMEKLLYRATFVLISLFLISSVVNLLIH
jgi:preprotein translocase subunit SecG